MNCSKVNQLLSAYYDGELSDELHEAVREHLGQCDGCAVELRGFERLSLMARFIESATPPDHLWERIEVTLDEPESHRIKPEASLAQNSYISRSRMIIAVAATIAVGIAVFMLQSWRHLEHHNHFTTEFNQYLLEFNRDPEAAQKFLLDKYENHRVSPEQATKLVGYRPVIAAGAPPEYKIASTFVVKMPCCTCVQTLCQRADGSALAIFEHNDTALEWFGDRPAITASCHGKGCCLVQLKDSTAVSWKQGNRYITVIGVREFSEIDRILTWLDQTQRPS
ncbi:anti-sigma factor family protein [Planctomicrobium sp. SH527]|uniref:anti-sigma factor family protein n=1 Tax=Planctomicrobium sp. SH527 TaxID=3448123 RepID=UPI003F5B823F